MAAYGATLEGGVKEVKQDDGETLYAVNNLLSLAGFTRAVDKLKQLRDTLEANGGVVEQLQVGGNSVYTLATNRAHSAPILASGTVWKS